MADFFVYVLRNAAGTTYTGIARDTAARLAAHNAGTGARFTRGRGPWTLVHVEGPFAHGDALRREAAIKRDRRFRAGLKTRPEPAAPFETGPSGPPQDEASSSFDPHAEEPAKPASRSMRAALALPAASGYRCGNGRTRR